MLESVYSLLLCRADLQVNVLLTTEALRTAAL
jgi:hypothetical protein